MLTRNINIQESKDNKKMTMYYEKCNNVSCLCARSRCFFIKNKWDDTQFLWYKTTKCSSLIDLDKRKCRIHEGWHVFCCLVSGRTWMPTTTMTTMLKMWGSTTTLLPPLDGMTPETTRSRLLTCAQTATPRTIIRPPMSTVGRALCPPPCLCEKTQRRRVCVCV